MRNIYISFVLLMLTSIVYGQSNADIRSGSTINPEIENLGGFKPDINDFTPSNNAVGNAFGEEESTHGNATSASYNDHSLQGDLKRTNVSPENIVSAIYPNPAANFVMIELTENIAGTIQLMNLVGQPILQMPYTSSSIMIDLTQIPEGIYFLSIETLDNRVVRKLKIQK